MKFYLSLFFFVTCSAWAIDPDERIDGQELINSEIACTVKAIHGKSFDEQKLISHVKRFNDRQLKKYGLSSCEDFDAPRGYITLKTRDLGQFFSLDSTVAERGHSFPIDSGIDAYQSVFFSKGKGQQIVSLVGPTFSLPDQHLQVSVPATMSCGGLSPIGPVSVFDLDKKREIFQEDFLQKPNLAELIVEHSPEKLRLVLNMEDILKNDGKNPTCDITSWSKLTTETYELKCDRKKSRCKKILISRVVSKGCGAVNGCD